MTKQEGNRWTVKPVRNYNYFRILSKFLAINTIYNIRKIQKAENIYTAVSIIGGITENETTVKQLSQLLHFNDDCTKSDTNQSSSSLKCKISQYGTL